jgi:hypothetical protein
MLRALIVVMSTAADELEEAYARIAELEKQLEAARGTRGDVTLCLCPHPEYGHGRPCGLEMGHDGVHESEDEDEDDLSSLCWGEPTDDDMDPELTDEDGTPPDGAPSPEDYGEPLPPQAATVKTTSPLASFRKLLRARIRYYSGRAHASEAWSGVVRKHEQEVYEALKAAWYGDVTFAERPKAGRVQVQGYWYLPDGPYVERVGGLAWLGNASADDFADAADAVLGAGHGS